MHGRRAAMWLLLLIVAWLALCHRRSDPDKPRGLVIFNAPVPDSVHWRWHWLDLASGASGELGYEALGEVSYVDDRTSLWMQWSGEQRNLLDGVLHVTHRGRDIDTRFVGGVSVLGVSPDGAHAAMVPHHPIGSDDVLQLARVTSSALVPEASLRVPVANMIVFGWFDATTPLVGDGMGLWRAAPGKRPVKLLTCEGSWYGGAAHDMRWFAWSYDTAEDEHQVLQIASLSDPRARPRRIALGDGADAKCEFAPGDRTIGCMVGDAYVGAVRVLMIDVASGKITSLGDDLGTALTFSPDGKYVMLFDDELTIVRVDGKGPRIRLGRKGAPAAWLR
jgi:hypothetical protein